MGLALSVGYLADVAQHDPEGATRERADFDLLNQFLRSQGLPPHHEPEDITPSFAAA